jgi:hypothetical protein
MSSIIRRKELFLSTSGAGHGRQNNTLIVEEGSDCQRDDQSKILSRNRSMRSCQYSECALTVVRTYNALLCFKHKVIGPIVTGQCFLPFYLQWSQIQKELVRTSLSSKIFSSFRRRVDRAGFDLILGDRADGEILSRFVGKPSCKICWASRVRQHRIGVRD